MPLDPTPAGPIIDGFTYNTRVPNITSYFHNVLAQLEPLRRANGYRCRWFAVPDLIHDPIPPFGSVFYQVKVQPGSYLWATNFWASQGPTPSSDPSSAVAINTIKMIDACTELPLTDKPALSVLHDGNVISGASQFSLGQNRGPVLLPQPYLVSAPGLINVEVTNGGDFDSDCQFVMFFAEPCLSDQELKRLVGQ